MAGRTVHATSWTQRHAAGRHFCRRLYGSLHTGQPSRVTPHHHEFATQLSQCCARCQPHSAAHYMKLFEMVELCLRANGERLDARISREFRYFDHLANPVWDPGPLPVESVDPESLPVKPYQAPSPGSHEPEQAVSGSASIAVRLHDIAQSTKRAVRRGVAPLLKRQAERERLWLKSKAIEAQQWQQEHHLLSLYCHLLHLSGFHLCSQAHAEEHAAMQSSMGIGVRVDWSSLDSGMLSRFDAYGPLSPYDGVEPPRVVFDNKRVLVAVKGHVVRERNAFFFADKFDELLRRAYLKILRAGVARVADPSWVQELTGERNPTSAGVSRENVPSTSSRVLSSSAAASSSGNGESSSSSATQRAPASSRSGLDRLTVRDLQLTVVEFLSRSTLREPCYSDVLVLFRRQTQWDTDDATLNPRNMFLRHYRRVPLADLTLLMPDKRPAMRAVDRLTCGSYSLTAALAAVPLLSSAHMLSFSGSSLFPYSAVELFSWTWILAASTFTAAASKVLFRYRMTKSYYHEAVNSHAARNSANSDGGVLSFLIEHATEEQFKRAIAVYTAMATADGAEGAGAVGMSASEIRQSLNSMLAEEPFIETANLQETTLSRNVTAVSMDTSMGAVATPWPATDEEVETIMDTLAPLGLWHPVPLRLLHRSTHSDETQQRHSPGFERRWSYASAEDVPESIRDCWSNLLEGPPLADCSWPWCDPQVSLPSTHDSSPNSRGSSSTFRSKAALLPPVWGEGIIFGLVPNLRQ